jgi:3-hydroxyacyl-CoA dehydrogenase
MRRRYLLLKEKDSFILNRIFLDFQNEAFLLVYEKKASLQQIDRLVREHFFPTGVFEFFDSVGLDVMLASVKNYSKNDPGQERYHPLILQLQELVSKGRLGMKTKGGFYGESISSDPGHPENDADIVAKLHASYAHAFRRFCHSSGIPPAELKSAMDEYFGVETPVVVLGS